MPTDNQLLACLEKMAGRKCKPEGELHLCWLAEETVLADENWLYHLAISCESVPFYHATWQQRVIALAKVKGIEL